VLSSDGVGHLRKPKVSLRGLSMLRRSPRAVPLLVVSLLVALSALVGWRIVDSLGLPLAADEFNLAVWEVKNFPNKWLYELGRLGKGGLSREEADSTIQRYIALQSEVAGLEDELLRRPPSETPAAGESDELIRRLEEKRGERDRLEGKVEAALEERISEEAADLGLQRTIPFFPRARWLFPPVDFEFDDPPRLLVTSPRDRIYLRSAELLRSDLTLEEALRLEDKTQGEDVSALVVASGGVATYPSIIPPMEDYAETLEFAAHEWLHQYLFFQPLGARYFESDALRTINETVADIAGAELGGLVAQRYPLAPSGAEAPAATPQSAPPPDDTLFVQTMRQLRLDVDRLLVEGRVAEAEALMEEKRQYLAEHGYFIRKINQAYFAFHGLYGTAPASSSPIGPKLEEIRRREPSLGEFIRAVSQVTSEADLDRLLASLSGSATPP
jgi:hypothetical protein